MWKHVSRRILICMGLSFVLCMGCTAAGQETDIVPTTAAPVQSATITQTPSRAPLDQEQVRQLIFDDLRGDLTSVKQGDEDPGEVFVQLQILLEDTATRTIRTAQEDTVAILQVIAQSGLPYERIVISGWAPITIDINSNTQNTELLFLRYDRETLEAIDWGAVRAKYIWLIASYSRIHDSLQE